MVFVNLVEEKKSTVVRENQDEVYTDFSISMDKILGFFCLPMEEEKLVIDFHVSSHYHCTTSDKRSKILFCSLLYGSPDHNPY